jgi:glutathionylspermidine synthase
VRALVQDPAWPTPARYRRFVRRAQLEALLPDHLVLGEPYLALNALLLEPGELALLAGLTETFSRAFQRAGQALADDVPALVELGFPWAAAELLAGEPRRLPLVGRFDFVLDTAGRWWLLEFNADTPSGVREAIAVDRLAHRLLPDRGLSRPSAALAPLLVAAVQRALAGLPPGANLGLVTTAGELEDLAQMAFTQRLLRRPLAARGLGVVLGDADNLHTTAGGLSLCGQRIAALYRYVPFEATFGSAFFATLYDAVVDGRLRLLNGLYGLLLQHKALPAWLWAHRRDEALPEEERAAIVSHLAPSWPIASYPPDLDRAGLVAKQVFGREGEEVFFGEDLDTAAWHALARRRTYVVQRRIEVAPRAAVVATSLGPRLVEGRATVGCFAVDGRFAGFYTRFGGKIITSRAKWLATLVEPGPGAP